MTNIINKAFILAAGLGTRLRPYTNDRPKPLVNVAGKTLLDRTLDHLGNAGVNSIIANTHYHADQIKTCLNARKEFSVHISHEDELLDTGGGIKNAIAGNSFETEPFFVLSGDGLWDGSPQNDALQTLIDHWNPETMDILMLLQPVNTMQKTHGIGDYSLDKNGKATRSLDKSGDMMFTSIRINHPRIFKTAPGVGVAFSYLDLMDKAQREGRLFGIEHGNDWHHISTPIDLETLDALYTQAEK